LGFRLQGLGFIVMGSRSGVKSPGGVDSAWCMRWCGAVRQPCLFAPVPGPSVFPWHIVAVKIRVWILFEHPARKLLGGLALRRLAVECSAPVLCPRLRGVSRDAQRRAHSRRHPTGEVAGRQSLTALTPTIEFRVQDTGLRVWCLRFRVSGFGFRV
jgi:hypothetical protein